MPESIVFTFDKEEGEFVANLDDLTEVRVAVGSCGGATITILDHYWDWRCTDECEKGILKEEDLVDNWVPCSECPMQKEFSGNAEYSDAIYKNAADQVRKMYRTGIDPHFGHVLNKSFPRAGWAAWVFPKGYARLNIPAERR